jgi:histidinol-phosphatase (PHP family)
MIDINFLCITMYRWGIDTMIYEADMHVHSSFSVDSDCPMEEMVKAGIEKKLRYICFTDHIDFNPADSGYEYYDFDKISSEIERLRDKYSSSIQILKGLEFGEPHQFKKEFEACSKRDYDYILAGVHLIEDIFVGEKTLLLKYGCEKLSEIYYNEIRKTVEFGGFDAIAHIDYVKRCSNKDVFDQTTLAAIMNLLVKNDIALEVNTQYHRRGGNENFPSAEKIKMFKDAGGSKIVIGSDAHNSYDLMKEVQNAHKEIHEIGVFSAGIFISRKFKRIG